MRIVKVQIFATQRVPWVHFGLRELKILGVCGFLWVLKVCRFLKGCLVLSVFAKICHSMLESLFFQKVSQRDGSYLSDHSSFAFAL